MHQASPNHLFRLKWSDRFGSFIPVAERTTARGKRASAISGALVCAVLAAGTQAGELPSGGVITSGSGSISRSGGVLVVDQTSNKLITQWSSFNIGPGDVVKFVQPSKSAVALNRVMGADPSVIQGA